MIAITVKLIIDENQFTEFKKDPENTAYWYYQSQGLRSLVDLAEDSYIVSVTKELPDKGDVELLAERIKKTL